MLILKNRIKNYNEKTAKRILSDEGVELKHYLSYIKKNKKIDFSKIELCKEDLLDNEYKYLNTVLNKYKAKELNKEETLVNNDINNDREVEMDI